MRTVILAPVVLAVWSAAGCSSGHHPKGPHPLDAKEIVQQSKPAIVRIEDEDGRVGTGFAIDPAGQVATNLHVVVGASDIKVTLLDGTVLPVNQVVALDPEHDLAIIHVSPAKPLPVLQLGDSDKVAAGDPVVAIGNPLGVLDYTVSDGLIAAIRQLTPGVTLLQISAPISQGSSGGPLFNPFGEVIGVAVAISTEGQNLNFAVPSNYVRALRQHLQPMTVEEFAELTRPKSHEIDVDGVKIVRQVPRHEVTLFAGCKDEDVGAAVQAISEAIELGAPLYNQGNHEACFKIYEGASDKLEHESACPGVREAFGAGLLRASTLTSYTEKAWALRDTFDGLIDVATRYAKARSAGGNPITLPGGDQPPGAE
ncbi:MAG TPA: trypsin-like peptidase domain-containing protein [Kofleriaceae bacterium]|nr:trypsin-like peptidase domain-containing protein [Kofleriaceae bacterium]